MSDEDIDLDRVVVDPAYRRRVIEFLNAADAGAAGPSGRDADMASHPLVGAREGGHSAV